MQNSIYKIKYLLFLSWDWEAWCLTVLGVIPPSPERNTAWNKGRKCFHCLGAPNNLIRPWMWLQRVCQSTNLIYERGKNFWKNFRTGKSILKLQSDQLDATITIYWSIRSAQHVSGNLLPIFSSVRLRFLQHMVSCCCGRQGFGERQRGTTCTVWRRVFDNTIPYAVKIPVLCSWRWAKDCPKHVELIL